MKLSNLLYSILFIYLLTGNITNQVVQDKKIATDVHLDNSLVLDVNLAKDEVALGATVPLVLTLKNKANYPVELFDPTLDRGFDIEVKNSKGINISLTKEGKKKKYPDIILRRETIRFEPNKE